LFLFSFFLFCFSILNKFSKFNFFQILTDPNLNNFKFEYFKI
jgi:hypothetical protein